MKKRKKKQWADLTLEVQQLMLNYVECVKGGMTSIEASEATGVTQPRFYRYLNRYPELRKVYDMAWDIRRKIAKHDAESALLKLVRGHTKKKTKRVQTKDAAGVVIKEVIEQEAEEIPPDQKAIEFYLRTRAADEWILTNKTENTININHKPAPRVEKVLEILDDTQAMDIAALFIEGGDKQEEAIDVDFIAEGDDEDDEL